MDLATIALLALIQGAAELLPVSSSAHVIVAEKLLGLDPSSPEMTFLLVMLHTGTMFAVLLYFGKRWMLRLRSKDGRGKTFIVQLVIATIVTGIVGLTLKLLIERLFLSSTGNAEIENLFGNLPLIAASLFGAGVLILASDKISAIDGVRPLTNKGASLIGAIQGLCLPFRGFSRSGATISTALALQVPRPFAEDFSFALAVILTPVVVVREGMRLRSHNHSTGGLSISALVAPGLIGMILSFVAGLVALKLLSHLLASGRWKYFGFYCFFASAMVLFVHFIRG